MDLHYFILIIESIGKIKNLFLYFCRLPKNHVKCYTFYTHSLLME